MQKQHVHHNHLDCDNDNFVSEQCFLCGEELNNTNDIFVGVNDDRYYHLECAKEHNIQAVKCLDIDLYDLICGD